MKKTSRILLALTLCLSLLLSLSACKVTKGNADGTSMPADATSAPATKEPDSLQTTEPHAVFANDSYGAAVGSLFQQRISDLPAVSSDMLSFDDGKNIFENTQLDAVLDIALRASGLDESLAALLQSTTFAAQLKTLDNTAKLNLSAEFLGISGGNFSIDGIYDGSDFYLTVPGYLDTALQLPIDDLGDSLVDNPDSGFAVSGGSALPQEVLDAISPEKVAQLVNAFSEAMGDCMNAAFSAIPDEDCSVADTTVSVGGQEIAAQQLTVNFTSKTQFAMAKAAMESLKDGSAAASFFDTLTSLMAQTGAYGSASDMLEELYDDLQDSIDDLSSDDFDDVTGDLIVTLNSEKVYGCILTVSGDGSQSFTFTFDDLMTESDGTCTISVTADIDGQQISTGLAFERLSDTHVSIDFHVDLAQYGTAVFALNGRLYVDGDSIRTDFDLTAAGVLLTASAQVSADDNRLEFLLSDVSLQINGQEVFGGDIGLTLQVTENTDTVPYAADSFMTMDEFSSNQELQNQVMTAIFSNPVLSMLASLIG